MGKVYIVGQHLSTTAEVRFNGMMAQSFTVYSDHLMRAVVPVGATTGKISLLLKGGAEAESPWDFEVAGSPSIFIVSKAAADSMALEGGSEPGLEQEATAYPNPFTEGVTIFATLQRAAPIQLVIFSELGQKVREIRYGQLGEGRHELRWDGKNSQGVPVARGLYFYQVVLGNKYLSGKLLKAEGGSR